MSMTASAPSGASGPTTTGGPGGPSGARGPGSTTGAGLGFCRVTIVAPDSRIDVALPDDVPVADLHPEILRLSQQSSGVAVPVGYHLVRRDGTVLDSARTFAAQRVLDGELLTLRPFAESLPPAVFDDVSQAVADAVSRDRALWSGELTRAAGLTGGGLLATLIAFVTWSADPRHDMNGLAGVLAAVAGLLLLTLGAVRARVYDDRASAISLGLGALPNLAVAGSGLLPLADGHGIGKLQFLLACAAVLLAAVVLTITSPRGDGPFVAFVLAAAIGLLTTFVALLADLTAVETAAICAPLAVGTLAFLPGLSLRFARLPIGFDPPSTTRGGYGPSGSYGDDPAPPSPWTPTGSPPRPAAAMNSSSDSSAAAPWSRWPPPPSSASPTTSGASSSPSRPDCPCCCAPSSSATRPRSAPPSPPVSARSSCSASASPSTPGRPAARRPAR